jgi:hypothetical protein
VSGPIAEIVDQQFRIRKDMMLRERNAATGFNQVFGMCISNRRTVADNAAINREIMARARSTQSQEHPPSIPSYFV